MSPEAFSPMAIRIILAAFYSMSWEEHTVRLKKAMGSLLKTFYPMKME
jgi:hypothetical protein